MGTPSWLARAAARSTDHSWTFGSIVTAYCEIEGCSKQDVAAQLDCSVDTLMWISLCRRPGPDGFAHQVHSIATKFGVSAPKLAAMVRRVDSISALRSSTVAQELVAARDRADANEEDS